MKKETHNGYSFVPHLCVDVIGEPVDDGAIIVIPDKGKVKVLNEVGTRIWQLINSQRSVMEIADIIFQEFDVSRDKALIETSNFIKNLQKAGIVSDEPPINETIPLLMLAAIFGVLLNFPAVVQAAVTLTYFTAEPGTGSILINWGTASEFDILGFYVLRSNAENGTYLRIHDDLIAHTGGSIEGAEYSFEDTTPIIGETYFYKLEVVDFNNQSEFYGPIFTTFGFGTFTPTVTRTRNATLTFTPTRTTTWTLTPSRTTTLTETSTATRTKTTTRTRTPTQTIITSTLHTKTATRTVTRTRTLSNVIYRSSTWTRTASPSPSNISTITISLEPSATSGTPTKIATLTKIPPLRLSPTHTLNYFTKQSDPFLKIAITFSIVLFLAAFLYFILLFIKNRRRKSEK